MSQEINPYTYTKVEGVRDAWVVYEGLGTGLLRVHRGCVCVHTSGTWHIDYGDGITSDFLNID